MAETPADPFAQLLQGMGVPKSAQEMRALLDGFAPMLNAGAPEIGAVHDAVPVEGAGHGVTADVLVPNGDGPFPVLVYLHGGGWVCGSPATHAKLGRRFADSGYLVFNVDYRLAPEHPFPTPLEDCLHAIRWAARVAGEYGGDAEKLAVGGDSAGGNLSAAAAALLADDPEVSIRAALLIYGVFDFAMMGGEATTTLPGNAPSAELAEAGADLVELMVGAYLGSDRSDALLADPRVSPLHAADRLPPSHVVCGTQDPLITHTRELVERLQKAGIEHEHHEIDGMPHGFVQMEFLPQALESIERMTAFLRKHVG